MAEHNSKSLEEVIYPEIEPGIINKAMIEKSYLEEGNKGEALRLHQMEPVVYDRITTLRLEFKNILRIDHLWILPNLTKLSLNCNKIEKIEHIDTLTSLKELDLSFNYIEKIENLDKLVNLEVLTLFNNLIAKIENMDALSKLVILSIGNNKIDSTQGVNNTLIQHLSAIFESICIYFLYSIIGKLERFRFLKNLSVLNLEGNPIAQNFDFQLSTYIAAVLPDLKYYEYVLIKPDEREKGKQLFYRELREIEANEEMELVHRNQRAKEEYDTERLSSSFVEYLNEHQLFESLWKGDDDGRILMMVGASAQELAEEYDKDLHNITQVIYKLGLVRYEERALEINEFTTNLEQGQNEVQQMGQKIIEEFLVFKDKVFDKANICLRELEVRAMRGEDDESPESVALEETFDKIVLDFDDSINEIWQRLMSQELHLHEAIEEATINFQRKMQELMAKFVEQAQTHFGQLRDVALHFSENMAETVMENIAVTLALQNFDGVPAELRAVMEDREAIMNLVAGMKDIQVQRIDEREDRMMVRSREFIENLITKLTTDELERNRAKILEINSFLEVMTEGLQSMRNEVREQLLHEDV